MIYTEQTVKALKLCFVAHKEQTDKSGLPYVFHPFHLAEQMKDEATTCVALLHDVVEDSDMTLEGLREAGFPEEIVEAVGATDAKSVSNAIYRIRRKLGARVRKPY